MPTTIWTMNDGFINNSQNDKSSDASVKDDSKKQDLMKLQEDNDD